METPGDGHGEKASISSHHVYNQSVVPLHDSPHQEGNNPLFGPYAAKRLVDDKVKLHSYAEIIADIAEKVVGHDLELKESVK